MIKPRTVRVTVSEGVLEGELLDNKYGEPYYSFKGIPYAEPPIGDLRFKVPQPPKPWTGIRIANKFGPICYQTNLYARPDAGSEDCLYLNVFTPNVNPDKPLPVMFYIHGGFFKKGSGNDELNGPEYLVRHDVILVTINYRLEVLGFLCLETEDIPGNAGMKDQVAALRWVNNNIKHFGGDPNNVTIFGISSGSLCVSYHLVSPMTKGLFKKAILQSSTNNRTIGIMTHPRRRALALARKLGFKSENNKKLYEFFKKLPYQQLVNAETPLNITEMLKNKEEYSFMITSEKKINGIETFFHGDPHTALRDGIHEGVDVITGYTADEGVIALGLTENIENMFYLSNNFKDYVIPRMIAENCSASEQLEVGDKIYKFYFGDDQISMLNIDRLIKYYSMYLYSYAVYQWAKICSSLKRTNKVYLYKFHCKTERNMFTKIFRANKVIGSKPVACHGDDMGYIFPMKLMNNEVDKESESFKIIDSVTKLWTNMAKYGNPTPDDSLGAMWKPFDPENQHYLEIDFQLTARTFPDEEEFAFWEDIYRTYAPQCVYK